MAEVSGVPKTVIAGRMAGRAARRNRFIASAWDAASATARSFSRVLRRLWHEVTGSIFLMFALMFAGAAWREYHHMAGSNPRQAVSRALLALGFSALFGWFSVSSFWQARRAPKP
jgi:hypothetical protein